jgi:hypothetical protein
MWHECEVLRSCRATYDAEHRNDGRRHLPIVQDGPVMGRTREIAQTPRVFRGYRAAPDFLPTTLGQDRAMRRPTGLGYQGNYYSYHQQQQQQQYDPRQDSPPPMGVSPSYQPATGQGVFVRLFMNIGNGILAAIGWHIWSYASGVDIFGRR